MSLPYLFYSASAAATVAVSVTVSAAAENKNERCYNDPKPAIIKDIAKTVIHKKSSVSICIYMRSAKRALLELSWLTLDIIL